MLIPLSPVGRGGGLLVTLSPLLDLSLTVTPWNLPWEGLGMLGSSLASLFWIIG